MLFYVQLQVYRWDTSDKPNCIVDNSLQESEYKHDGVDAGFDRRGRLSRTSTVITKLLGQESDLILLRLCPRMKGCSIIHVPSVIARRSIYEFKVYLFYAGFDGIDLQAT